MSLSRIYRRAAAFSCAQSHAGPRVGTDRRDTCRVCRPSSGPRGQSKRRPPRRSAGCRGNLSQTRPGCSGGGVFGLTLGVGEAVGLGAGLDDGAAKGESVNDRGAELGVGEVFAQPEKGIVRCDRDGVVLRPPTRYRSTFRRPVSGPLWQAHIARIRTSTDREETETAAVMLIGAFVFRVLTGTDMITRNRAETVAHIVFTGSAGSPAAAPRSVCALARSHRSDHAS